MVGELRSRMPKGVAKERERKKEKERKTEREKERDKDRERERKKVFLAQSSSALPSLHFMQKKIPVEKL